MSRVAEWARAWRWTLVAVGALAFAYSYLVQPRGDNQAANYVLVRALADGTPRVDRGLADGAHSIDVVTFEGHRYAAKPPGLAAFSVLPYLAIEAVGIRVTGDPFRPIWALHLWSVVLPAIVLLLLVAWVVERVEPGLGAAAAVIVGAATLVLPFAMLFFVHLLATCLVFAAFVLLWRERDGPPRPRLLALAGLLAGLSVTTDYPLGLPALALGGYALLRSPGRPVRALAYGGGLALGVLPALAFNRWAFGSAFHFPYEGWAPPGGSPHDGFFGATWPSYRVALQLLFFPGGIAILLPAIAGAVLLWRRGLRVEIATIAAVALPVFLHNAATVDNPFGGFSPGPRHLIPIIPFLAIPLAAALRAFPGATAALAAGGVAVMAVYSVTTPLAAFDRQAVTRFRNGDFVPTITDPIGIEGGVAVAVFFVSLLVAIAAAVRGAGVRSVPLREVAAGAVALGGWILTVRVADEVLYDTGYGRLVVTACALAVVAVLVLLYRPAAVRRQARAAT